MTLDLPPDRLRAVKDSLVGVPVDPLVVVGSSDGRTAGMDGVDRWLTDDAAARGWCVLRRVANGREYLLRDGDVTTCTGGYELRDGDVVAALGDAVGVGVVLGQLLRR